MKSIVPALTKLLIFVVITVGATAMLGLTIANAHLGGSQDYSARFTDVTSLNVGDDVRIAGREGRPGRQHQRRRPPAGRRSGSASRTT